MANLQKIRQVRLADEEERCDADSQDTKSKSKLEKKISLEEEPSDADSPHSKSKSKLKNKVSLEAECPDADSQHTESKTKPKQKITLEEERSDSDSPHTKSKSKLKNKISLEEERCDADSQDTKSELKNKISEDEPCKQYARKTLSQPKRKKKSVAERNEQEKQMKEWNEMIIRLRRQGFAIKRIGSDGNCLFRALGYHLEGHERGHMVHRQAIVQFMRENKSEFKGGYRSDAQFENYLQNMSRNKEYGDDHCIRAFCRMHNVIVNVYYPTATESIGERRNDQTRVIRISFHNGNHFNAVEQISKEDESVNLEATKHRKNENVQKDEKTQQCNIGLEQLHQETEFLYVGGEWTKEELDNLTAKEFEHQKFADYIDGRKSEIIHDVPKVLVYRDEKTGLGLKAGEDIKEGSLIREYTGKQITNAECEELHKEKKGMYIAELTENTSIDALQRGNESRFISHKCGDTNAKMIRGCAKGSKKPMVQIVALRDIKYGETITVMYNDPSCPEHLRYPYIKKCLCDFKGEHIYRHPATSQGRFRGKWGYPRGLPTRGKYGFVKKVQEVQEPRIRGMFPFTHDESEQITKKESQASSSSHVRLQPKNIKRIGKSSRNATKPLEHQQELYTCSYCNEKFRSRLARDKNRANCKKAWRKKLDKSDEDTSK